MDEIYEILEGDTLSRLAEKFKMTTDELLDLNPEFKKNPDLIFPGQELRLKPKGESDERGRQEQWNKFSKNVREFKEDLRLVVTGKKDLKDTGMGQFLGTGKDLKDTKLGQILGGGKPFEQTNVGKALGGGKPFEQTDLYQGIVAPLRKSQTSPNPLSGQSLNNFSELEKMYALVPQKRAGGLINKYQDGGMFSDFFEGDFFTNLFENDILGEGWKGDTTKFGETKVGEWLGSEKGQETLGKVSEYLKKPKSVETEASVVGGPITEEEMFANRRGAIGEQKSKLEEVADQKLLQGSHYVDYVGAGAKVATGNIPGAIMDMGKIYLDLFKRGKEKRKAKKGLKKIEEIEDTGFLNLMGSNTMGKYQESLLQDDLTSRQQALEKYGISSDEDVSTEDENVSASKVDYSMPAGFMKRGGTVNSDAFPFLSDSYKRYLAGGYALGGEIRRKRPEHLKYDYASGGMVNGASHKNGGEKFNVGGEVVELEGGEAVINKKSTEMFKPILSQLNQAGGGVSFARGGLVNPSVNRMIQRLMNKNR